MTGTTEISAADIDILAALDELGDGLDAWYVERGELLAALPGEGLTDRGLSRRLRALEGMELVEPTFQAPFRWRIRRKGEALLIAWRRQALVYSEQIELIDRQFQMTLGRFLGVDCDLRRLGEIAEMTAEETMAALYYEQGARPRAVAGVITAVRRLRDELRTRVR